ncbi:uncharacterized protein N7525_010384 [Penicillium rubens]|uniref:uncharacterized protein n=1 Tax=Penicillium rubens TaxID=1108849 RepID=UPI002A5A43A1|nr:uncharacterized protein N7525_010384 [Penicillium rubens]KAJ5821100.1 hypothetical protein N7525_010384 [Penicillium rubens]
MAENADSELNAIHETHEESSTVAGPHSTRTGPFIIFIARSSAAPSRQVKQEWLLEFLHWVEQVHLQEYGSLDSRSMGFIPFFQSPNRQLPTDESTDADCGVIRVISGWDGLTTHNMSMVKIIEEAEGVDVTLRFYLEDLNDGCRYFRDVKLRDAYKVLREDIEATDDNPSLQAFAKYYKGIQASKTALAVAKQDLNGLSFRRNSFVRPEDYAKWNCSGCGVRFKSLVNLTSHTAKAHREWSSEEQKTRDRHVQVSCPQNPGSEKNTKVATITRKKRGTMVRVQGVEEQPMGSDNGLKPYLSVDPADFHNAPRIDVENPIIYRGEISCRHPDCSSKKVTRYTQKSIVRGHYRREHSLEYRPFSKSLNAYEEQLHIDGLRWISICVQRGQEQAGAAPVPRKW